MINPLLCRVRRRNFHQLRPVSMNDDSSSFSGMPTTKSARILSAVSCALSENTPCRSRFTTIASRSYLISISRASVYSRFRVSSPFSRDRHHHQQVEPLDDPPRHVFEPGLVVEHRVRITRRNPADGLLEHVVGKAVAARALQDVPWQSGRSHHLQPGFRIFLIPAVPASRSPSALPLPAVCLVSSRADPIAFCAMTRGRNQDTNSGPRRSPGPVCIRVRSVD